MPFRFKNPSLDAAALKGMRFSMPSTYRLFILLIALITITPSSSRAQIDALISPESLADLPLEPALLAQLSFPGPQETLGFTRKSYDITDGKQTTVEVADYNPHKSPSERWTLRSLGGRSPTTDEITSFKKKFSEIDPASTPNRLTGTSSLGKLSVLNQDDREIILGTGFSSAGGEMQLPPFNIRLYLDLKDKFLKSISAQSTKSVSIGIAKANNLFVEQSYGYPASLPAKYLVLLRSRTTFEASVLWVFSTSVEHIEEYSNYKIIESTR